MPCRFLIATNLGAVALAIVLPLVSWGRWFGFVTPPLFFAFLVEAISAYLGLVEVTKVLFYRFLPTRRLEHT